MMRDVAIRRDDADWVLVPLDDLATAGESGEAEHQKEHDGTGAAGIIMNILMRSRRKSRNCVPKTFPHPPESWTPSIRFWRK